MDRKAKQYLSPREQQVMEAVYRLGRATVAEVTQALPDAPSNSALRTHLRLLEGKGHLRHTEEDGRFTYFPTHPRQNAARTALSHLLHTFFDNSAEKVVATLLSVQEASLSDEDLDRLKAMIDEARKEEDGQ